MRKRKQTMLLVFLIVFVIVLIVAYFAMIRVAKSKEAEAVNDDAIELFTLNTDTAKKLNVENENGTFVFVKAKDAWTLESDKSITLNETVVSTMLSTLKTINASRSVREDVEDLSEYGLDKPKITISVELEDGVRAKIELGNEVPIQGGYYGMVDGENHVYVMDESYYTNFCFEQSELE